MQRCVPTCWERKLKLGCLGFNSSEHVVVEVLVHIRLFDRQLVILKAVLVIVVNVVRCNSCGFCVHCGCCGLRACCVCLTVL